MLSRRKDFWFDRLLLPGGACCSGVWWTCFQWLGVCSLSSVILCIVATFPVAVFKGALEVTMGTLGISAVVRILGVIALTLVGRRWNAEKQGRYHRAPAVNGTKQWVCPGCSKTSHRTYMQCRHRQKQTPRQLHDEFEEPLDSSFSQERNTRNTRNTVEYQSTGQENTMHNCEEVRNPSERKAELGKKRDQLEMDCFDKMEFFPEHQGLHVESKTDYQPVRRIPSRAAQNTGSMGRARSPT